MNIKPQFFKFILAFFFTISIYSQTLNNISKDSIYSITTKNNDYGFRLIDEPIIYNYCDEDGFVNLDIKQITTNVLAESGIEPNDNEAVLISTSFGKIIKINNPFTYSTPEVYCSNVSLGGAASDVAVDEEGEIYITQFSSISKLNTNLCIRELVFGFQFGTDVNSLSFDTNGNLYYGFGSNSQVYRYDADESTQPYIWHDFGSGRAGGDFVMLNGNLYVAWKLNNSYRIYEVTVDSNIDYVSHIDLGEIPNLTYGLASEFGKLYGVTPNKLYRIELDSFNAIDVATNDGTYGEWFGAAGLHEAIVVEASAYISSENANNSSNSLPDFWTNTQFGGQTIYIRIDNISTGEFTVVPTTINIGIIPQITQPNAIVICSDEETNTFNLFDVENELLANVNQEVIITYYETHSDLFNIINPLTNLFDTSIPEKRIYVNVESVNSGCRDFSYFNLVTNNLPSIAPIINNPTERLLSNCYIDSDSQGYFDLNEIYDDVVNGNHNYDLQFYSTYQNAENEANALNSIYFSSLGIIEEIFIRVINEDGCYKITNFFINGDCVLTTGDYSNINFPKFFTPNYDGYHDYWSVKGISNRLKDESEIYIFNRYGKLLTIFKPSQTLGWDGLNDTFLPNDDYWYKLTLKTGEIFTGHFSLVR